MIKSAQLPIFTAMMRTFFFLILWMLTAVPTVVMAQNEFDLWAARWGLQPGADWASLMRRAPAYMGPNALPLPPQAYPRVDSHWVIEGLGEFHAAPGDYTQNAFVRVRLPLAAGRVAMDLVYRPIEWYQTSPEIRDLRRARDTSGTGMSNGDVWITTIAQLLRAEHNRYGLDLTMNVAVKTTAGKNLENARFTNSPGYIFDWHLGKTWKQQGAWLDSWRLYGNAGLFVWQKGVDSQNDAWLAGLAADFRKGPWQATLGFTGYVGWLEDGDAPFGARTEIRYQPSEKAYWLLGYQHNFQHLTTHLLRVGGAVRIPHKHK